MTVEELRAVMRRRVVPENLVVQNIVEYLMDDSAQLPRLNAFTFLSRLQQLGMASADFVVLLEGCGAPPSLVDKIKANPAMNLNSLVLALDNSGLTSEDYSRILYTARLVWEQTQTSGKTFVPNEDGAERYREKTASELFDDEPESVFPDAEGEPSFEEIMKHIHSANFAEIPEKKAVSEKDAEDAQEQSENDGHEDAEKSDEQETHEEITSGETAENTNVENSSEEEPEADEEQSDEQSDEEQPSESAQPANLNDTSTLIISIDREQLRKDIERSAAEFKKSGDDLPEENDDDNSEDDEVYEEDIEENSDDADDSSGETDSDLSDDEDAADDENENDVLDDNPDDHDKDEDKYDNSEKLRASGYNKPALIASAVGALVLLLIGAYFTFILKLDNTVKSLVYAKTAEEIFTEVHKSYNAGNMGGENAQSYFGGEKLFGTMLISDKDLGMLSDGSLVYTANEDRITAHESLDINTGAQSDILPPENTRFVEIWAEGNSIIAVFSGKECGFMRIEKGKVVYTALQDGELCDFAAENGEISIGSVYVPYYAKNFTAADVEVYLPRLGKNEKAVLPPENIALGHSSGCSFAVWGKYSISDGDVVLARAAIGDPVYAGAYGVCAMNYMDKDGNAFGRIISLSAGAAERSEASDDTSDKAAEKLIYTKTDKMTAAADSKNTFAVLQGEVITVFDTTNDADISEKSILENLAQLPDGMKFDGDALLLSAEDGIFAVIDCADTGAPAVVETHKASGIVSGNTAALFDTDGVLEVTLMKLENGEAKQIGVYTKQLSESEKASLELGGANSAAILNDSCAFSYRYFDGVSVVSVCAVFGKDSRESLLFDDRTGFRAIFAHNGSIIAVSSKGAEIVFE